MCLYPKLIRNKKYTETKKNRGEVPSVSDLRTLYVPIGCQNCIECRKKKARDWQVRMQEEIKHNKNGKFITLTFSDDAILKIATEIISTCDKHNKEYPKGYSMDNAIATKGMRLFLERWRKETTKSVRHWTITELGHNGTKNIHLHGILWTDKTYEQIEKIWQYGHIWPKTEYDRKRNYVNAQTVNYMIKYISKTDEENTYYKGKILCTAGIGKGYTEEILGNHTKNIYKKEGTNETYRTNTGHKIALPIYYRNKIYTEEEKEKLWIEKLNKETRYVMGTKIDISKTDIEYYKQLKQAREKNIRLGYGNDRKDYNKIEYENTQRMIMQETRIIKAKKKREGK